MADGRVIPVANSITARIIWPQARGERHPAALSEGFSINGALGNRFNALSMSLVHTNEAQTFP
ncbi:MAG TPA: hypothetical protein VEI95_12855 [Acidobacteriota bacterium]|nr:hypothetical protein [Acidobacteriota bacterium]